MEQRRTVYRCCYYDRDHPLSGARESRLFKTEKEARAEAERLKATGHRAVVWRYHEVKVGRRWEVDLDSELTQSLDS